MERRGNFLWDANLGRCPRLSSVRLSALFNQRASASISGSPHAGSESSTPRSRIRQAIEHAAVVCIHGQCDAVGRESKTDLHAIRDDERLSERRNGREDRNCCDAKQIYASGCEHISHGLTDIRPSASLRQSPIRRIHSCPTARGLK